MTKKLNRKFEIDVNLFKPEPPVNAKLVKALFVGREKELECGIRTLQINLDVKGKRSKSHDKRPWVIHGESRSGKSHLARRILAALPHGPKRLQITVDAREQHEAVAVMRQIFERLYGEFGWRVQNQLLAYDASREPVVQLVDDLSQKMRMFFGGAEKATVTIEQGSRNAAELGLEMGGGSRLFKFLGKFQSEVTEKQSLAVTLRDPTPLDLADLCGIMVETLLRLKLVEHVLFLIDDVDLLSGYVNEKQNAKIERSILASALDELHSTPGADVLLSARSWYAHSQKDFQTLIDLASAPPMTPEHLIAIHDRRYHCYGRKKTIIPFLTAEALNSAVADVHNLPGIWLRHLDTAFRMYQMEDDETPRNYAWYIGVFRKLFDLFRQKLPDAANVITDAVKLGRLTMNVATQNPVYGTVFDDQFVYQSYYSETTYLISGVSRSIVDLPLSESAVLGAPGVDND